MEIIASVFHTGGLVELLGSTRCVELVLKDDESYKENCEVIANCLKTRNVRVITDMPKIYEQCWLDIAPGPVMERLDAKMNVASLNILRDLMELQQANGGFVSFSALNKLLSKKDTDCFALPEDVISTTKSLFHTEGWKFNITGSENSALIHRARQVMKDCVTEKGTMDMWDNLRIDTEAICNLFGDRGITVKNFASLVSDSDTVARVAIDTSVTRFPRLEDPFFRVSRFRVVAFQSKVRLLAWHTNSQGMFCRFQSRKYDMTKLMATE